MALKATKSKKCHWILHSFFFFTDSMNWLAQTTLLHCPHTQPELSHENNAREETLSAATTKKERQSE